MHYATNQTFHRYSWFTSTFKRVASIKTCSFYTRKLTQTKLASSQGTVLWKHYKSSMLQLWIATSDKHSLQRHYNRRSSVKCLRACCFWNIFLPTQWSTNNQATSLAHGHTVTYCLLPCFLPSLITLKCVLQGVGRSPKDTNSHRA